MHLKRRRGATLGFVAVIVLFLLIIGVAFFVIAKMLGGGRELANSVDAGTLNVAKFAFLQPSKAAREFTNPDVANNFELLSPDGKFRLENYNRLVAQSMIVALNAKEEGTPAAAANAKKVWDAVNDVARFLRTNHGNAAVMGSHFQNIAGANNLKMMGQNGISLNGYDISYTARGEATNVFVDPRLISNFAANHLPMSRGTRKSPTGNQFLAGYAPLSVALSTGTLVFSGIPVSPQDRPHLVSGFTFDGGKDPGFMPGYPAQLLPPNTFRSAGETKESHTQTFGGAVASAIVGSLDREYEAGIPNGYIEIKNGPSLPPASTETAETDLDIFSHALAGLGIDMTPNTDWFCRGSDAAQGVGDIKLFDRSMNDLPNVEFVRNEFHDMFPNLDNWQIFLYADQITAMVRDWDSKNLIDRWAEVNALSGEQRAYLRSKDIPKWSVSKRYIRHGNGDEPRDRADLETIGVKTNHHCVWQTFSQGRNQHDSPCVPMLENFKRGYREYGTTDFNDNGSGFTCLEKFKTDVLTARKTTGCCVTVRPSETPSGMKVFRHGQKYPAPLNAHNFGSVESPIRYLTMIDSAEAANGCALGSTIDLLHKRCRQIKPSISREEVVEALSTSRLPLNATYYLYVTDGRLTLSDQRPPALIRNTTPDGEGAAIASSCGSEYRVIGNLVNAGTKPVQLLTSMSYDLKLPSNSANKIAKDSKSNSYSDMPAAYGSVRKVDVDGGYMDSHIQSEADVQPYLTDRDANTDGRFPGWCFRQAQDARCKDSADWVPSSGYNNLLGQLRFNNSCRGGGQFCQPN